MKILEEYRSISKNSFSFEKKIFEIAIKLSKRWEKVHTAVSIEPSVSTLGR
jgi:hypothetical protein